MIETGESRTDQAGVQGFAHHPAGLFPITKERDFKKRSELKKFYVEVRQGTQDLCRPLQTEDFVVQPIEDASPPKWHLGHTT